MVPPKFTICFRIIPPIPKADIFICYHKLKETPLQKIVEEDPERATGGKILGQPKDSLISLSIWRHPKVSMT